ncbi:thiamine phosphate synthase [Cutibacterium sp. WCA-380-WT-3A]|uniref:Thiamine-phosphate synthase n=1 Tax=Cutibacterium porci TaxID=2605781 RepID=A0A7K0J4B0_9ACTN|nr:thiamine phosphate synthase [Cutibacterium porci]MSS44769.1 thiamine phosphate synthase [Cutibacterium porci]
MTLDLRCYLVTSGTDRHTVETAALAAGAGAGIVQVRAKELSTRDLLSLVLQVGEAVRRANSATRVVVDDRADVAWAAMRARGNIHGVHIGSTDLPVRDARAMLGPEAIIGYTTGTLDLVQSTEPFADALDYVGAGPFRPTPTKDSGRAPRGVQGYPALVKASSLPIVAIGDVQVADVPSLVATGVSGVAMVRAIMGSDDPAQVVRQVVRAFDGVRVS